MGLDFDVTEFLENCRATKPPFQCPYDNCRKVYKTYQGILYHFNVHHSGAKGDSAGKRTGKRAADRGSQSPASDYGSSNAREALTYEQAQRIIEVDIDGRLHRINITEPLDIVCFDTKNGINESKIAPVDSRPIVPEVSLPSTPIKSGTKGKGKEGSKRGKGPKGGKKALTPGNKVMPSPAPPVIKLPEPSFRKIEGYDPPDASPRPTAYFRYIEKSPEELDESVEYDMDEEDSAWLELINQKRQNDGLSEVPEDTFEELMDRLEKESYFLGQNSGKDLQPAIDEDAVCCICSDGECQNTNAILFCDMCNLAVHQECYGVPYIPEGQWLCRRCLNSPSSAVDCVLCPNRGGAFKQTDDGRWAHVVCALWIPEVCFANTVFLEPIDCIENIPQARWKLNCYICKQRNVGACIQCHKSNCYVAFHVTCAQQTGLFMKMEAVREGALNVVRKAAYCHTHTPADENGTSLMGVYDDDEDSRSSMKKQSAANETEFKEKIKKARKTLAEKRSAAPVVSIPTIPPERLTKIVAKINFIKRNEFILRLLGYWQLKRQSRNGVPLLRRLQISHASARREESQADDDEQTAKIKEDLSNLHRLRQNLERARLSIELLRKREKIKKEAIKYFDNAADLQMQPFNQFLLNILGDLQAKDHQQLFAFPVDTKEIYDYLSFVKQPMDFSTMRSKIENSSYSSLKQFEADYELILANCQIYNGKATVFYKTAEKLRSYGKGVFKEANLKAARIGYNYKSGLHDPPTSMQEHRTNTITEVQDEEKRLRERLEQLEQDLSHVRQAKSGGSRTKKIKYLCTEMAKVHRELGLLNPTMFHDMDLDELPSNLMVETPTLAPPSVKKSPSPKKSPKKKQSEKLSDSEATDIIGDLTPIKLPTEGRRTMNSVSAAVSSIEEALSPRKSTGDSPKKSSKNSTPTKPKKIETPKKSPANGKISNSSAKKRPMKITSKATCDTSSDEEEKETKSAEISTMADAATCTPSSSLFEKLSKTEVKGVKRKSKGSQSKSKKMLLGDSVPEAVPQSDSFRMYRTSRNSSSEEEAKSESSNNNSETSESDDESGSSSNSSSSGSASDDEDATSS
ncbi:Peregrin [Halotydeus destructor]|nr:Peregrin [Halotydeus destructor]